MTHGIYSAGAAMVRLELHQEITANNLANAATSGFRRDLLYARQPAAGEPGVSVGPFRLGALSSVVMTESGSMDATGNRGDLAISGEGYFAVEKGGATFLTRSGAFTPDANGELVNASGERLLGEGGPIAVARPDFQVTAAGEVISEGAVVDTIRIVAPAPGTPLRKAGDGRIEMPGSVGPRPEGASILQGYLEGSNVNAIREMISLVEAFRTYEANSKTITTADALLDRAVNQVGRIA